MKPSLYLISPKIRKTFYGFDSLKWIQKKASFMPLGMATVASIAKKHCSKIILTDARFQKINYDTGADIVGISFYIIQKNEAFKIAEKFRKLGKYVIMGGSYPTSNPEECQAYADSIFCGEAEYTINQFFKDFKKNKPKPIYKQIQKIDMKDSPIPAYHLLPMNEYGSGGINYSRGCPFNCEFCDIKEEWFNGRKVRQKNIQQILSELDELKKFKYIETIFIHDDNFSGNIKAVKELLYHIVAWQKKNKYPFNLTAEASLNIAKDDELLDLFYKAGFRLLFIGIETPNIESLKISKKYQNTSTNIMKDIKKIQSYGLDVWAGMITGFDGDKKDIFEKVFDFIQKSGIMVTSLGPLQALDGTPLKERLIKEGRYKEGVDLYHPAFGSNRGKKSPNEKTFATINFKPLHMTDEELIEGTNWILRQIYNHKNFTKRFKVLLNMTRKKRKKVSHSSVYPHISFIPSLLVGMYNIFFSSKEAFYYNTKLFLEVLLRKPHYLKDLFRYLGIHASIFSFYKEAIENPNTVRVKCPIRLTD